jgi:thiol:disulfide interchange protein DsbC
MAVICCKVRLLKLMVVNYLMSLSKVWPRGVKLALAAVPLKEMIIYPSTSAKTKGIAYVFTDVDCGYCRKIHNEIPAMNQMGIEVRYLAFPRAGYPSPTSQRMDAIWCHAKPNEAMTLVKNNQPVPPASCANPIKAQYELGQELGVRGTPAVFLEDGTQVGGYYHQQIWPPP